MSGKVARALCAGQVAAILALGIGSASLGAGQELRIDFLAPMTGPFAQIGRDMVNGFQMYLEEVGGNFTGAKVSLILEDEEGKRSDATPWARPRSSTRSSA